MTKQTQAVEHTAGPWAIGLCSDEEKTQVITSDGQHLCFVEQYPIIENARLIAAAPELLAALQLCEIALECATTGKTFINPLASVSAAIQKAKL